MHRAKSSPNSLQPEKAKQQGLSAAKNKQVKFLKIKKKNLEVSNRKNKELLRSQRDFLMWIILTNIYPH